MIGNFVSTPNSPYYNSKAFSRVLEFVKSNPPGYKMYEKGKFLRLSKKDVTDIKSALESLRPLLEVELASQ